MCMDSYLLAIMTNGMHNYYYMGIYMAMAFGKIQLLQHNNMHMIIYIACYNDPLNLDAGRFGWYPVCSHHHDGLLC